MIVSKLIQHLKPYIRRGLQLRPTLRNMAEPMASPTTDIKPTPQSITEPTSGAEKRAASDDVEESDIVNKKLKTESEVKPEGDIAAEQQKRLPKKKVAFLLSYSGKGYLGMQRNKGVQTIEEDLLSALVAVKAIPQEHADVPQKMQFQRCARTDKGVSAVRQIVSLKIVLIENVVEKLNNHLPPPIRVITCNRTTGGFNAKNACSHRTYSYMAPTFAFSPKEQFNSEKYRITDDVLEKLQRLLDSYKGTHNFHNFTSGKAFNDQSAYRYMKELKLSKPFVRNDLEFVVITIVGQSFMIHQIRKMVGLVIAIVKGYAPESSLNQCYEDGKMDIPKAPSLGLMLENVHFDPYNKRYGNDGIHEALTWEKHEETICKFKEAYIFPTIIETEESEKSMMQWLTTLQLHTYDTRNDERNRAGGQQNKSDVSKTLEKDKADSTKESETQESKVGDDCKANSVVDECISETQANNEKKVETNEEKNTEGSEKEEVSKS